MKFGIGAIACLLASTAGLAALAQPRTEIRTVPAGTAPGALPAAAAGQRVEMRQAQLVDAQGALQPDPAAKMGTLPNGMRYIVYRNATPPGQASVRMHFRAGDLMERDEQNGLAHFIEHMVLNETRNLPEGELLRTLERQGMAFGREVNAFTAPDQTVYVLSLIHI